MKTDYQREAYSLETVCPARENALNSKRKLAYIRGTWELPDGTFWKAEQIRGDLLTDLNISFALIDSKGKVFLENKAHLKNEISKLQKSFPDLRVNISIGGWGADGFSNAASSPDSRKVFVDSVVTLIQEMNFYGVDIDWEYPVGPEWGQEISSSPHDKEGYILLLSDLRKALYSLEEKTGIYYTVTTAVPSSYWFTDSNDTKTASYICDYLNLMCYDYYGEWSETTGFNSSLCLNPSDPNQWSSELGVERFAKAGIPAEKLVMGIPFYGFGWAGVPEGNSNGLFQKPKTFLGNMNYKDILQKYSELPEFWDEKAKCSFLYDKDSQIFVTYTSERHIKEIATFAKSLNLGGLMYWEYANDMDADLLTALSTSFE